jgi:small subunit ribosomal protein S18
MKENKPAEKISIKDLTWKDVEQLRNYTTETGKILPRRITHFTAQEQRHFTKIVKQARNFLLMP